MSTNVDFILRNGLQVNSNVAIGSYSVTRENATSAPVDGLIVSGNVGIGSSFPTSRLAVTGNVSIFDNGLEAGGIVFPDGTWQYTASTHSAAGVNGSVQFNDGNGSFTYDSLFDWDNTNKRLGVGTATPSTVFHAAGSTPALFATKSSADYQIDIGASTSNGAAVGFNTANSYGYLKLIGGSDSLSWNSTGVGIGGVEATNTLDVSGGAVIGGGGLYAGTASAPSNGLLVQGSVGIGTYGTPAAKLEIRSDSGSAGLIIKGPTSAPSDFLKFVDNTNANKFVVSKDGEVTTGVWKGSVVAEIYGGTNQTTYDTGDTLYASAQNTLSKLVIGTDKNIMVVSGGVPSWGTLDLASSDAVGTSLLGLSNGGTNASLTASNGGIVYSGASAMAILSASSTSGNVLLSGAAGAPSWGYSYTSSNVANSIVSRDGNGDVAANKITAESGLAVTSGGAFITGDTNTTGTALVNALTSNGAISGTTVNGTAATFTSLNSTGDAIVNTLTSNGAISGTTITGTAAFVTSLNSSGAAIVSSLTSNGAISGTTAFVTSLNSSGAAIVNSLTSNGAISGTTISGTAAFVTSLNSTGDAIVNTLTSNGAISGTTLSATDATVSSLNSTGDAIVNTLTSNGAISGTTATVTSLNSTGAAIVNSLTSNGAISGTTISGTAATFTSLNSTGAAIVSTLTSNGAISGTTLSATDATVSSLNSTGAAIVSTLTSNGAISGTTLTATAAKVSSLNSTGTATVASLVSNASVSGNTWVLDGSTASTGGTGALTVDTWANGDFRTAHYIAQITDTTASSYHATQFMLIQNGTDVYKSEYNMMWTVGSLGTFDATSDGTTVTVTFTPVGATSKTVKLIRTAIDI